MDTTALFEERVLFSPDIPPTINSLLQSAVAVTLADPITLDPEDHCGASVIMQVAAALAEE